ncbi:MAG: MFS transporter, partial [Gammaproteobacteria bacterium]|nr:MFS transporter [Gammaproteobacteria bacterium]
MDHNDHQVAASFKQNILAGVIGNVLEWYDFAVYAYLAPIMGALFFPKQDKVAGVISVFIIFALGYAIRPVGGLILGHIADKHGRKKALLISIFMMTIPTVLIGFLPVYHNVALMAPLLLVLLRMAQGVSAGGELTGSAVYLYEAAPPNRRGFWCSMVSSGSMCGVLLGSLVGFLLHAFLPHQLILSWGWRLPFLLALPLGLFGFWMRTSLKETAVFKQFLDSRTTYSMPIISMFKEELPAIIKVILINIFVAVAFYLLFVWMPTYLQLFVGKVPTNMLLITTIVMLVLIILTPISGWLSDKVGRRYLAIFGISAVLILTYPLFSIIISGDFGSILAAQLIFAFCIASLDGVLFVVTAGMFQPRLRASGLTLAYNIPTAFLGGTAPLVCTY